MKKNVIAVFVSVVAIIMIVMFNSCSGTDESENVKSGNGNTNVPTGNHVIGKPLNITILLDLSDRITKAQNPSNTDRDIEAVKSVISIFKEDIAGRKVAVMDGSLKVLFYPTPNDPNVASMAKNLEVSVSKNTSNLYELATDTILDYQFESNLRSIYELALSEGNYPGCDIWRFIKNQQGLYMKDIKKYRNVLVVITDGYVFHEDNKEKDKNRYTYLLSSNIKQYRGLNCEEKIKKDDFGLISTKNDLSGLEVLVLEVNPDPKNPGDYDIIKLVLTNWFTEMGASKCEVYQTDLPSNTKTNIENFIK